MYYIPASTLGELSNSHNDGSIKNKSGQWNEIVSKIVESTEVELYNCSCLSLGQSCL